jgi:hypothetical protein
MISVLSLWLIKFVAIMTISVSLFRRLIWPLRPDSDPEPSILYVSVS